MPLSRLWINLTGTDPGRQVKGGDPLVGPWSYMAEGLAAWLGGLFCYGRLHHRLMLG